LDTETIIAKLEADRDHLDRAIAVRKGRFSTTKQMILLDKIANKW
jgi:hypothetical protein